MNPSPDHPRASRLVTLDCRRLRPSDAAPLAALFEAIVESGADALFHPHPFTAEMAETICSHRLHGHGVDGQTDEYHVAFQPFEPDRFIAYGMLRGWSEGYAVPSLGIAVHPEHRGRGVAKRFMAHLHAVAADRGADRIRLKVYRHNEPARRLYETLGYEFTPHSETEWIGFFQPHRRACTPC